MRWSSAVSDEPILDQAVAAVAADVLGGMGGEPIDLAVVFVSHHHAKRFGEIPELIREAVPHRTILGCSAGGVIGGAREVEQRSGLSLTVASLPGVTVSPIAMEGSYLPDLDASPTSWREAMGVPAEPTPHFVLLADPFSFPAETLLAGLDFAYPRSAKIGGLASGARRPGGNALYLGSSAGGGGAAGARPAMGVGAVRRAGAVAVALSGDISVDAVVAQGCRPVGRSMRVTRCDGNVLLELDGKPPLEKIREVMLSLPESDRQIASHALFLGIVTNELLPEPGAGDFLIRNLVGLDPERGAIAVGDRLRNGQMVQFHLRDPRAAAEDLDSVLTRFAEGAKGGPRAARGALLFSCLGRGINMYGRPDHDTEIFRSHVGDVPLGGFFCNGEIGPVGGMTYLHGYTSAFGIFRPARG